MEAFKNHSMIRDRELDDIEKILKKFKARYLSETLPPIGHVYSIMIETLMIDNPNLSEFLEEFNEYIEKKGDPFAKFESPRENLWPTTLIYFKYYLKDKWPNITDEQKKKILTEAHGGCIY